MYGGRMADLYTRKASFDLVKQNKQALEFHKDRFESGSRDALAKLCYQHWQYLKNRSIYEVYTQEVEGK